VESEVTRDWLVYGVGDVDLIVEQVKRDDPESTELVGRYTASATTYGLTE
jgi:hypothetical protein